MISIGANANPAFGTSRASIPLGLPANKISASGCLAFRYPAAAIAGLICPAVPPQANKILIPSVPYFLLLLFNCAVSGY